MAEPELKCGTLTVDSLFDCCKLLDAIGIEKVINVAFDRDEFAKMRKNGSSTEDIGTAVMAKLCGLIIANIPKAKDEICTFLAGCLVREDGKKVTVADVKALSFTKFVSLCQEFFKQDDIADFFKEVAKFVGMGGTNSQSSSITDTATEQETT